MELREFDKLFADLKDYFGDRHFPPKVGGVIFQIVRDLSPGEFSLVIENLIQTSNRAPTPALVKQAATPFLARARERLFKKQLEELEASGKRCTYCDHTGFVSALLRSNAAAEFSFRCPFCPAARIRRHSEKILWWSDALKETYVPFSLKSESFTAAQKAQAAARKDNAAGKKSFGFAEKEILAMLEKARKQPAETTDDEERNYTGRYNSRD